MPIGNLLDQWLGTKVVFARAVLTRIEVKLSTLQDHDGLKVELENWGIDSWMIEELKNSARDLGIIEFRDLADELEKFNKSVFSKKDTIGFIEAVQFRLGKARSLQGLIAELRLRLVKLRRTIAMKWLAAFLLILLGFVIGHFLR